MLNSFKALIKLKEASICQEWYGTYGCGAQESGLDWRYRFEVIKNGYVKPKA